MNFPRDCDLILSHRSSQYLLNLSTAKSNIIKAAVLTIMTLPFIMMYLAIPISAFLPALSSASITGTNGSSLRLQRPQSSSLKSIERIGYLVPTTHTFVNVLFHTEHVLDPVDVEKVLSAIEQQLTFHIDHYGDGPLSDEDDPYEFGVPGCSCATGSHRRDSLTYEILSDVVRGLQYLMVDKKNFYFAYYEVYDGSPHGRELGDGEILSHAPPWSLYFHHRQTQ